MPEPRSEQAIRDDLPAHYFDCDRLQTYSYGTRQGECDCSATADVESLADRLSAALAAKEAAEQERDTAAREWRIVCEKRDELEHELSEVGEQRVLAQRLCATAQARAERAERRVEEMTEAGRQRVSGIEQPSFVCPKCSMRSYNPNDIRYRYCGNCNEYADKMATEIDRITGGSQ